MEIEGKLSFAGNRIIIVKKDNSHVVLDDMVARDLVGKDVRVTLEVLAPAAPPPPQPIVSQATVVAHQPTPLVAGNGGISTGAPIPPVAESLPTPEPKS